MSRQNMLSLFLDDEFIQEKIDEKGLLKIIKIMRRDPFISYILFTPAFSKGAMGVSSKIYKHLNVIRRIRIVQNSANAAIWRTGKLRKYLNVGENPWRFEINSKKRRGIFDRCYSMKELESPIRTSFLMVDGYGIAKGKWLWKNAELFEKNGIKVDMSERGIMTEEEVSVYMEDYWKKRREREKRKKNSPLSDKIKRKIELFIRMQCRKNLYISSEK